MNKKGFTLVELIGVVMILAILAILAFPPLLENIRKTTNEVDSATKELLFSSADLYLDRLESEYPKINGNVYCISLDILVESGDLKESVVNLIDTGKVNLKKTIKATVKSSHLEYELIDHASCEQINN